MKQEKRKMVSQELAGLKKALKEKCIDCMCGQKVDCNVDDCSLYPHRPYRRPSKRRYDEKF